MLQVNQQLALSFVVGAVAVACNSDYPVVKTIALPAHVPKLITTAMIEASQRIRVWRRGFDLAVSVIARVEAIFAVSSG